MAKFQEGSENIIFNCLNNERQVPLKTSTRDSLSALLNHLNISRHVLFLYFQKHLLSFIDSREWVCSTAIYILSVKALMEPHRLVKQTHYTSLVEMDKMYCCRDIYFVPIPGINKNICLLTELFYHV